LVGPYGHKVWLREPNIKEKKFSYFVSDRKNVPKLLRHPVYGAWSTFETKLNCLCPTKTDELTIMQCNQKWIFIEDTEQVFCAVDNLSGLK
jgi:hypothetical protein